MYEFFAGKKKQQHVVEDQKMSANHREKISEFMILVLFYVREDARIWGC